MNLHVYMNLQLYDSSCLNESDSLRDPESGVQMRFRSVDPRSVNESESEQINGSMFRG